MLIHILKIIKNNLRANLLLVAGIFVIATSLWYAVDYVYAVAVNGQKSLGFEWENVYYIQVGVLPQESLERDTTTRSPEMMTGEYLEFCNRLKRHPAVKDLCYTRMHFHYVWKNGFKTVFYDTLQAGAYTRMVSPGYFSVFGVKGADGCSPEELSKRARPEEMVMTDNLARYLISGKEAKNIRPAKVWKWWVSL